MVAFLAEALLAGMMMVAVGGARDRIGNAAAVTREGLRGTSRRYWSSKSSGPDTGAPMSMNNLLTTLHNCSCLARR